MLYLELGLVFLLTIINGLLAMSELAVVSARPARLRTMSDQGVNGARDALALASDPGRFLSSVQIGITLVGILSGAFSGATLGDRLSAQLMAWGLPVTTAYVIGVGLVVTLITYMSLIIGELVPKQIALRDPERIACLVSPAMTVIARLAAPIVWLLNRSGKLVLALIGLSKEKDQGVTEDEIRTLVAEAETAGVLEPGEREMITGVMRLGDRPVRTVMTPRMEVDLIDLAHDPDAILRQIMQSPHSRFPVYDGNPEEIVGIMWTKDLVGRDADMASVDLRSLVRQAPIIPESMDALDVLNTLKSSAVHMGLVHDEYGHFEGVVTSADILEAIVGAFETEEGAPEPQIVERGDGSLLVAGWMPVDEFADRIGLTLPPNRSYETVAGFVIARVGRLPAVGETFDIGRFRIEIVDLDGRRIDKLLVSPLKGNRRAAAA
ncbi:MAG: DNA-binding protein [Rhizobiales bacterium 65-9]|nr:HlyC/CorC family transporter [Hyphomicrobiales bacterium]OJY33826.1 MAG: DNA-binding protein [Rhizobiales bacterium 65-9]